MSLETIQTILLIIYIALTMLLMGLRLTWSEVKTLADHGRLITKAIIVNILIIPIVAIILVRLIDIGEALAVGLFVVAAAPAAPFAPKFAERVKGPFHVAVGLMFVLALLSVVTTPATITLILLSQREVSFVFPPILFMLVIVQLLPLLLGVTLNSQWESLTSRIQKPLTHFTNILALFVVTLVLVVNWGKLSAVTWPTVMAVLLLVLAGLFFGWLLGGPMLLTRRVMAFTSSARNVAVALLIVSTTMPNLVADISIILYMVIMIIVDIFLVMYWQKGKQITAAAHLEDE
jgi:BASS family bile acid:Na+ symporter